MPDIRNRPCDGATLRPEDYSSEKALGYWIGCEFPERNPFEDDTEGCATFIECPRCRVFDVAIAVAYPDAHVIVGSSYVELFNIGKLPTNAEYLRRMRELGFPEALAVRAPAAATVQED